MGDYQWRIRDFTDLGHHPISPVSPESCFVKLPLVVIHIVGVYAVTSHKLTHARNSRNVLQTDFVQNTTTKFLKCML